MSLWITMRQKDVENIVPVQMRVPFPVEMFQQGGVLILRAKSPENYETLKVLGDELASASEGWPADLPTSILLIPSWCDLLQVDEITEREEKIDDSRNGA